MKKFVIIIIVLLLLCFTGCKIDDSLADQQVPDTNADTLLNIYVCGAVEKEGFVVVNVGNDYFYTINQAGILPVTKVPSFGDQLVSKSRNVVVVDYVENGVTYSCINVNGPLVTRRAEIANVDDFVVDLLADYIEQNGTIRNRAMLQQALGEYYQHNFYKFFVGVDVYEKAN